MPPPQNQEGLGASPAAWTSSKTASSRADGSAQVITPVVTTSTAWVSDAVSAVSVVEASTVASPPSLQAARMDRMATRGRKGSPDEELYPGRAFGRWGFDQLPCRAEWMRLASASRPAGVGPRGGRQGPAGWPRTRIIALVGTGFGAERVLSKA